jgi:hypothetical protein
MFATLLRDKAPVVIGVLLLIIGLLMLALGGATHLYLGARDDLNTQAATAEQAARDAQAEKEAIEAQHAVNLAQVRKDHEAQLPAVRANAVANYRAAHRLPERPAASDGVSADAPGIRLDDGTERQCIPDDTFIEDSAEDVEKLATWQDWCKRNNCPVEE